MAGIIDYINDVTKKFQFLKWVQIIPQESLATKKSALYFVEKNSTEVDAIVIDDLGQKRKLTGGGTGDYLPLSGGTLTGQLKSTKYDGFTITSTKDGFNYYTERSAGHTIISKESSEILNEEKGYALFNSEGYMGVGVTNSTGEETIIALNAISDENYNPGIVANKYLGESIPLTFITENNYGFYYPQVQWVKNYTQLQLNEKVDLDGSNIIQKDEFKINLGIGKFSYKTGGVTANTNQVILELKTGGNILVYNSSTYLSETQLPPFDYTPITTLGKSKKIIIFGLPIEPYFFFEEGEENTEVVDPILPDGAYIIYQIIAKYDHQIIIEENNTDISGKLDKPLTTSDFTAYPNIVAVDGAGNSAKVSAGSIDFVTSLFTDNAKWFMPNVNQANYFLYRVANIVALAGATNNGDVANPGIILTSSGSTIATSRGSTGSFLNRTSWKHVRKFSINSTVSTQRIFVGLSVQYRITAPTNVALTTLTQVEGICMQSGSNKIYFIWNDSSGSANLSDSGFTNGINNYYLLTIIKNFAGTELKMRLDRFANNTGYIDSANITITSDFEGYLSANPTVFVNPAIWCVDSATTSPVVVTDFGGYEEQRIN